MLISNWFNLYSQHEARCLMQIRQKERNNLKIQKSRERKPKSWRVGKKIQIIYL